MKAKKKNFVVIENVTGGKCTFIAAVSHVSAAEDYVASWGCSSTLTVVEVVGPFKKFERITTLKEVSRV